ncbi:hypothetical protein AYO47_09640 [Planctomyces sp. SCGC AG-212-M04]|nr:hypothetical protein AYO47_09640 [Planctomyces sp. SCGC AG-212-M04]
MRRFLILAISLLTGCITSTEVDNNGVGVRRTYLGFIPVAKKTFVRPQTPAEVRATNPQMATSPRGVDFDFQAAGRMVDDDSTGAGNKTSRASFAGSTR